MPFSPSEIQYKESLMLILNVLTEAKGNGMLEVAGLFSVFNASPLFCDTECENKRVKVIHLKP